MSDEGLESRLRFCTCRLAIARISFPCCTVSGLLPGTHHVVFQWDAESDPFHVSGPDGRLDAGEVDFSVKRQITGRCKAEY